MIVRMPILHPFGPTKGHGSVFRPRRHSNRDPDDTSMYLGKAKEVLDTLEMYPIESHPYHDPSRDRVVSSS